MVYNILIPKKTNVYEPRGDMLFDSRRVSKLCKIRAHSPADYDALSRTCRRIRHELRPLIDSRSYIRIRLNNANNLYDAWNLARLQSDIILRIPAVSVSIGDLKDDYFDSCRKEYECHTPGVGRIRCLNLFQGIQFNDSGAGFRFHVAMKIAGRNLRVKRLLYKWKRVEDTRRHLKALEALLQSGRASCTKAVCLEIALRICGVHQWIGCNKLTPTTQEFEKLLGTCNEENDYMPLFESNHEADRTQ